MDLKPPTHTKITLSWLGLDLPGMCLGFNYIAMSASAIKGHLDSLELEL